MGQKLVFYSFYFREFRHDYFISFGVILMYPHPFSPLDSSFRWNGRGDEILRYPFGFAQDFGSG
jgi:hypothetical protein